MNLTYVLLHFLLRCEILGADMTHDVILFMHILFSIFARNFCWCSNSLEYQPIALKSDNCQILHSTFSLLPFLGSWESSELKKQMTFSSLWNSFSFCSIFCYCSHGWIYLVFWNFVLFFLLFSSACATCPTKVALSCGRLDQP